MSAPAWAPSRPRLTPARVARALALAAAFALPLWILWGFTAFDALAPSTLGPLPTDALVLAALLAAALVALLQRATSPLPWLAALAAGAEAVALYPYTTIDWTRLLKDWGLVSPGAPASVALALALAPFVVAFAAHAIDHGERLALRLAAKGVPEAERLGARGALARRAAVAVGGALAGTFALHALAAALRPLVVALDAPELTFVAPVLVALVLSAIAWAFLARGAEAKAE